MQIKYFDFWKNDSPIVVEAKSLRAAYLLADEIFLGGEHALRLLAYQKPAQFSQKQILSIAYSNVSVSKKDIEAAEFLESLSRKLKQPQEVAKLPKDRFILYKKLENGIKKIHDNSITLINQDVETSDLRGMNTFLGTPSFKTGFLEISSIHALALNKNPEDIALKMLDFIFGEENPNQPSILLMGYPFFGSYDELKADAMKKEKIRIASFEEIPKTMEEYFNAFCKDEKYIEENLRQETLSVPSLHNLTSDELRELKKQLKKPLEKFNHAMNEWILVRKNQIEEKEPMGITHFNMLRSAVDLERTMNEIPLLEVSNASNFISPIHMMQLSITTCIRKVQDLWEYFEEQAFIQPEVIAALRKLTLNNPAYPERIPILGMHVEIQADKNEILNDAYDKTKPVITSKKKSMDLED